MKRNEAHKILGTQEGASDKDIKKAYKRAASKAHPDKKDGSDEKMQRVNQANAILTGKEQSDDYQEKFNSNHRAYRHNHAHDMYKDMMRQAHRGSDYKLVQEVDLELIVFGGKHDVKIGEDSLSIKIPAGIPENSPLRFRGRGGKASHPESDDGDLHVLIVAKSHPVFQRSGYTLSMRLPIDIYTATVGGTRTVPTMFGDVRLKIPAGTESGNQFKVAGKGIPIPYGNKSGNLICIAHIYTPTTKDLSKKAIKHLDLFNDAVMANGGYGGVIGAEKVWPVFKENLSKFAQKQ